jgi:hypothetical protein
LAETEVTFLSNWPEDDEIRSFGQLRQKLAEVSALCKQSTW